MREKLKRNFFATGIGSVPHLNAREIIPHILKNFPAIPFWPQLPKRSFFENMYAQFIEGFPGAIVDSKKGTVYIDTSKDFEKNLEEVYQKIIDVDKEYFRVTKERAEGFYELLNQLKLNTSKAINFVKGHVTGPISFGLSVTDEKKKPILYNLELNDLLTRILTAKIKWQIEKIKEVFDDVIIFLDEPYLVSIGSSVVNIKRADAVEKIRELVKNAIHFEGSNVLAGVHCCGNTDWSLLLESDIDILNFDAYNFMESISLYPKEIRTFLDKGGFIAWGIVPTSKEINNENPHSLVSKLENGIELLVSKGISREKLLESLIVTPSCGCGTLTINETEKVLTMAGEVSDLLKKKHS